MSRTTFLLTCLLAILSHCILFSQDQDRIDELIYKSIHEEDPRKRIGYQLDIANAYMGYDYLKSIQHAQMLLEETQKYDLPRQRGYAYQIMGDAHKELASYRLAIKLMHEAIAIFKELQDTVEIGLSLNKLGNVYYRSSDLKKAKEYYLDAKPYFEMANHKHGLAKIYNNLGIVTVADNPQEALKYHLKSVEYTEKEKLWRSLAIDYNNIGCAYMDMGEYKNAEIYMLKSLHIADSIQVVPSIVLVTESLGQLETAKGNYRKAIQYLRQTIELSEKHKILPSNVSAYKFLSKAYEGLKDYEKAYFAIDQSRRLYDSIFNKRVIRELTDLELQLQMESFERNKEQENQLRKQKQVFYIAGALVLAILIAFVVGFILIRNRNRILQKKLELKNAQLSKELLEEKIEAQNKDLITKGVQLSERNELLKAVLDKLHTSKPKFKKENIKLIDDIITDLKSHYNSNYWEEFENYFKTANPDFQKKLMTEFPSLTPNDLKLCTYLRLNMSTKEIANITFMSPNSIDVARSRIRKKLGLDKSENLTLFLSNY